MDAKSMDTNVDTDHALLMIGNYLAEHPDCFNASAIIRALEIVMKSCYFKLDDTFWHQVDGTAMGAPPAPTYATLYYGIYEEQQLLPAFTNSIAAYFRYIDDGLGLWICHPDPLTDEVLWDEFCSSTAYGKLTWEVSTRQLSVDFLDLTLSLRNGRIHTTLYEKELNLYLYLPPHSAHPPGLLRGFVIGMIGRILKLTTDPADCRHAIRNLFLHLRRRGYPRETLVPLFHSAYEHVLLKAKATTPLELEPDPSVANDKIFLHLPYNALDPSRQSLQRLFRHAVSTPPDEPALWNLKNYDRNFCPLKRMVVAYHRPPNLKNFLFPRRFRPIPGKPFSLLILPSAHNNNNTSDMDPSDTPVTLL
jgi:hypothetical protein